MKYNILINQYACVKSGLDLDLIDLAVLDFIKDFSASKSCIKTNTPEGVYFWVSHQLIIDSMPILKIKTRNGMLKRIDNLVNAGILTKHPNSKILGRTLYSFGINYDLLAFKGVEQMLQPTDESMQTLHTPVITPTDESIQYNNYNNNTNSNNIINTASNEIFAETPQDETELFTKQPEEELKERKVAPKERKTLFSNSDIYKSCDPDTGDYEAFLKLFNKPEYEQIDLVYYFNSVNDWSDQSNTKRTVKGWIATVRTFMRGDMNKNKLKLKPEYTPTESGISQESMIKYLNDDY